MQYALCLATHAGILMGVKDGRHVINTDERLRHAIESHCPLGELLATDHLHVNGRCEASCHDPAYRNTMPNPIDLPWFRLPVLGSFLSEFAHVGDFVPFVDDFHAQQGFDDVF